MCIHRYTCMLVYDRTFLASWTKNLIIVAAATDGSCKADEGQEYVGWEGELPFFSFVLDTGKINIW